MAICLFLAALSRTMNSFFGSVIGRIIMLVLAGSSLLAADAWHLLLGGALSVYVLTMRRVSRCLIYSPLTRTVSMSVNAPGFYRQFSYIQDREKMAELFRADMIEGFSQLEAATIHFSTHGWFIAKILDDPEIVSRYVVNKHETGFERFPLAVFLLVPYRDIIHNASVIYEAALRKRPTYKITMKRREGVEQWGQSLT